jgi:hypothetical protein
MIVSHQKYSLHPAGFGLTQACSDERLAEAVSLVFFPYSDPCHQADFVFNWFERTNPGGPDNAAFVGNGDDAR